MLKLETSQSAVESPIRSTYDERWLIVGGNRFRKDVLAAIGVVCLVLLFFSKTLFLGKPISKIGYLPEWDSLYSALWTGTGGSCDPSILQLTIPYYFITANLWQGLHLPLWNQFSGFGAPLVGDIQASVFSPLRALLFLIPTMQSYNLTLVGEVVLSALGTFLLIRSLRLGPAAAAVGAITYSLCPYNLFYLEQTSGISHSLFPLLFCLFVRLADKPSFVRCAAAGIGSAILILSGHPESAFFGITFGCLLLLALMFSDDSRTFAKSLWLALINITVTGIVSFCCAAPVLLPFVEYLMNSDSYKFTIGGSTWVPWQGILYNLLQPGFNGASPYLGILTAVLFPLTMMCAISGKRAMLGIGVIAVVAAIITSRFGPVDGLFMAPPLNAIINLYCLPVFLLLFTVLSANAFQQFTTGVFLRGKLPSIQAIALLLGTAAVAVVPLLLAQLQVPLNRGDFDMMIPHMAVNLKQLGPQFACLLAFGLLMTASLRIPRLPRWVFPVGAVLTIFASQALVARSSLPIQQRFNYPATEPMAFLKSTHQRVVALGDHLVKPNTNAVYGVSDIRTHNAVFTQRYLNFMKASGADVDMFNQTFRKADSKLLDIASVRYALSLEALSDPALSLVSKAPSGIHVYERTGALNRAYLVHFVRTVETADKALAALKAGDFDPSTEAIVETEIQRPAIEVGDPKADSVVINSDSAGNLTAFTESDCASLLVVTDAFYPGWVATVDGGDVPILRTNYVFRGVQLPAGKHTVVMTYRPQSFFIGVALAASCMASIGMLLLLRRRKPTGARING